VSLKSYCSCLLKPLVGRNTWRALPTNKANILFFKEDEHKEPSQVFVPIKAINRHGH